MEKYDQIAIIIPALNPQEPFTVLIRQLLKKGFVKIVVVNDGSAENSAAAFEKAASLGCTVLHHYVNLGKGRALKTAFNYCLTTWPDLIGAVTADADGQHAAEDIAACAKALLEQPEHLIMGCRSFDGAEVPFRSRWGNRITCGVMSAFCGVRVSDTQTGLRAVPASFMKRLLNVSGERFEFETNMLLDTAERKIPILEIPIQTIYQEGNHSSHFNPLRDSLRIYSLFLKFISASLSSSVVDLLFFWILVELLRPAGMLYYIAAATVLARIVSAVFNYLVNSHAVFKKGSGRKTAVKYFLLCAAQTGLSAVLVQGLFQLIGIPEIAVKIMVDIVLFLASFQIQRRWIFS